MIRTAKTLFLALAVVTIGANAQTNQPLSLAQISGAMAKADTVFLRFVQEKHLSLFNEPLRSEGFLCFQKPGRIRWETTVPYKSILVSDGTGVAQFEWADDKWKKLDLGLGDALQAVVSQIAVVMAGGYANGQHGYNASVTNGAEGYVVTLVPQNEKMRTMMSAIEVHFTADLKGARRVVLREQGGDYTDIRFEEQTVNFTPPPNTFDRKAPADIETVRQAAQAKQ